MTVDLINKEKVIIELESSLYGSMVTVTKLNIKKTDPYCGSKTLDFEDWI